MRYRRYRVRQASNGAVDVVSYGIFGRMLWWWLGLVVVAAGVVLLLRYWIVAVVVVGLFVLMAGLVFATKRLSHHGGIVERALPKWTIEGTRLVRK